MRQLVRRVGPDRPIKRLRHAAEDDRRVPGDGRDVESRSDVRGRLEEYAAPLGHQGRDGHDRRRIRGAGKGHRQNGVIRVLVERERRIERRRSRVERVGNGERDAIGTGHVEADVARIVQPALTPVTLWSNAVVAEIARSALLTANAPVLPEVAVAAAEP